MLLEREVAQPDADGVAVQRIVVALPPQIGNRSLGREILLQKGGSLKFVFRKTAPGIVCPSVGAERGPGPQKPLRAIKEFVRSRVIRIKPLCFARKLVGIGRIFVKQRVAGAVIGVIRRRKAKRGRPGKEHFRTRQLPVPACQQSLCLHSEARGMVLRHGGYGLGVQLRIHVAHWHKQRIKAVGVIAVGSGHKGHCKNLAGSLGIGLPDVRIAVEADLPVIATGVHPRRHRKALRLRKLACFGHG